jgi:hypothetical protein
MQNIFSCTLNVEGKNVEYHVVFKDEKYVFEAVENGATVPSFSFAREDNQWIDQQQIDPQLRKEALEALEKYLLSQN